MKLKTIKYALTALALFSVPAHAMTLEEALVSSYQTNPSILGERSRLAATKENVDQARAGYLPTVNLELNAIESEIDYKQGSKQDRSSTSGIVTVTQSIYRGGRTDALFERSEQEVKASEAGIHNVKQEVFLQTVKVYTDVIRDKAVYDLTVKNEDRLKQQLDATLARRSVGEVTKTDVSQAKSRYSQAQAEKLKAEGDLETSFSNFERVVGKVPSDLSTPTISFPLPSSLTEAIQVALSNNPSLVRSMAEEKAARQRIIEAEGASLPEVDLVGQYENSSDDTANYDYDEWEVKARVRVNLYQGGALSSRERQSKHNADLSMQRVMEARRQVTNETSSSWQAWKTAVAQIQAFKSAVESAELAYDGVQQEAKVGSRTVLDVLDAQQELLQAEVNLVRAEREEIVQRFELLAVMGRLTPEYIGLPVLEKYMDHQEDEEGFWESVTNVTVFGSDE